VTGGDRHQGIIEDDQRTERAIKDMRAVAFRLLGFTVIFSSGFEGSETSVGRPIQRTRQPALGGHRHVIQQDDRRPHAWR
jgi:hypothetical protein